jgi:hypothetical protein
MRIARIFTEHPASVGESYGEHFVQATRFGARLMFSGVACMVHAVLPILFVRTASNNVTHLHGVMTARAKTGSARAAHGTAAAAAAASDRALTSGS